ncbi:MAG: hypothetical protein J6K42_01350 [Clostridia bacterium]|nr:hypothetical protein [Clostridia bacterium]
MNDSFFSIILILIFVLIIILLAVLGFLYYKEKMAKNKEEEFQNPKKDESDKTDKKSVFRFMEFDEVEDNMVVQDGGTRYLMIVECKGINYDLLSSVEKASIEEGFMQFLNTLKHEIQLYIQTRKINLSQSTQRYREKLEELRKDLQIEEEKYEDMQRLGNVTKDEILREIKEVTKKRNLYEYGKDLVENTEQMGENRDITTKQYYIIIPYYTDEITSAGDFDKREISSMAFSELYTRAQSIVSGLTSCDVRGRILNSQEIVELLYVAYNREQYDIYDFETYMSKSGYQSLYSVSEDVLEKKIKAIDEEIVKKANRKAVDAFEYATEEMKMKKRIIEEREQNMQKYIDNIAEQIVDSEINVLGEDMAKMTKDNIRKMTQRENERKEKEQGKQLTEEERKRRILAKKRRLMKERAENEKNQNRKKQSN